MGSENPQRKVPRLHIDAARFIPAWLSHLNNRLSSGASQIYLRRFGVGINEWRVLSMLAQEPQITAARVGQNLGLHKAIVSRSVHDLESKGLLTLQYRAGQRLLELTDAGHALHDEMIVVALARERMLLAGFSDKERDTLLGLLRRMHANLPAVDAIEPGDVATLLPMPVAAAAHAANAANVSEQDPANNAMVHEARARANGASANGAGTHHR
jgi:DNA-binding MarR family transcriptional regulator